MDSERLASLKMNQASRKKALEMFELLKEEEPTVRQDRYWEEIAKKVLTHLGLPPNHLQVVQKDPPMDDDEARKFSKELVPFGAFGGKAVFDVPPPYWESISNSDFSRNLQRYLKSDYYQRMQEE